MRSTKKPNARQLTSTLMAIVMTATTTFQVPNGYKCSGCGATK